MSNIYNRRHDRSIKGNRANLARPGGKATTVQNDLNEKDNHDIEDLLEHCDPKERSEFKRLWAQEKADWTKEKAEVRIERDRTVKNRYQRFQKLDDQYENAPLGKRQEQIRLFMQVVKDNDTDVKVDENLAKAFRNSLALKMGELLRKKTERLGDNVFSKEARNRYDGARLTKLSDILQQSPVEANGKVAKNDEGFTELSTEQLSDLCYLLGPSDENEAFLTNLTAAVRNRVANHTTFWSEPSTEHMKKGLDLFMPPNQKGKEPVAHLILSALKNGSPEAKINARDILDVLLERLPKNQAVGDLLSTLLENQLLTAGDFKKGVQGSSELFRLILEKCKDVPLRPKALAELSTYMNLNIHSKPFMLHEKGSASKNKLLKANKKAFVKFMQNCKNADNLLGMAGPITDIMLKEEWVTTGLFLTVRDSPARKALESAGKLNDLQERIVMNAIARSNVDPNSRHFFTVNFDKVHQLCNNMMKGTDMSRELASGFKSIAATQVNNPMKKEAFLKLYLKSKRLNEFDKLSLTVAKNRIKNILEDMLQGADTRHFKFVINEAIKAKPELKNVLRSMIKHDLLRDINGSRNHRAKHYRIASKNGLKKAFNDLLANKNVENDTISNADVEIKRLDCIRLSGDVRQLKLRLGRGQYFGYNTPRANDRKLAFLSHQSGSPLIFQEATKVLTENTNIIAISTAANTRPGAKHFDFILKMQRQCDNHNARHGYTKEHPLYANAESSKTLKALVRGQRGVSKEQESLDLIRFMSNNISQNLMRGEYEEAIENLKVFKEQISLNSQLPVTELPHVLRCIQNIQAGGDENNELLYMYLDTFKNMPGVPAMIVDQMSHGITQADSPFYDTKNTEDHFRPLTEVLDYFGVKMLEGENISGKDHRLRASMESILRTQPPALTIKRTVALHVIDFLDKFNPPKARPERRHSDASSTDSTRPPTPRPPITPHPRTLKQGGSDVKGVPVAKQVPQTPHDAALHTLAEYKPSTQRAIADAIKNSDGKGLPGVVTAVRDALLRDDPESLGFLKSNSKGKDAGKGAKTTSKKQSAKGEYSRDDELRDFVVALLQVNKRLGLIPITQTAELASEDNDESFLTATVVPKGLKAGRETITATSTIVPISNPQGLVAFCNHLLNNPDAPIAPTTIHTLQLAQLKANLIRLNEKNGHNFDNAKLNRLLAKLRAADLTLLNPDGAVITENRQALLNGHLVDIEMPADETVTSAAMPSQRISTDKDLQAFIKMLRSVQEQSASFSSIPEFEISDDQLLKLAKELNKEENKTLYSLRTAGKVKVLWETDEINQKTFATVLLMNLTSKDPKKRTAAAELINSNNYEEADKQIGKSFTDGITAILPDKAALRGYFKHKFGVEDEAAISDNDAGVEEESQELLERAAEYAPRFQQALKTLGKSRDITTDERLDLYCDYLISLHEAGSIHDVEEFKLNLKQLADLKAKLEEKANTEAAEILQFLTSKNKIAFNKEGSSTSMHKLANSLLLTSMGDQDAHAVSNLLFTSDAATIAQNYAGDPHYEEIIEFQNIIQESIKGLSPEELQAVKANLGIKDGVSADDVEFKLDDDPEFQDLKKRFKALMEDDPPEDPQAEAF